MNDHKPPRKTLSLPKTPADSMRNPHRRPVRGRSLDGGHKMPVLLALAADPAEPTSKTSNFAQQKPRNNGERPSKSKAIDRRKTAAQPRPSERGQRGSERRPSPTNALARPQPKAPVFDASFGASFSAPDAQRAQSPVENLAAPSNPAGVRVSKLLAGRGLCSRREADAYIERGWVYVDGERISELGTRADPNSKITLDKAAQAAQQRLMTILLHKPIGFVSGQPEPGFTPAITLILPENQYRTPDTPIFHASHLKGLAPAGRLDVDSTGLLVLTQDGRIARQLIGERSLVKKEYLVRIAGRLDSAGLALLNHGLELDGKQLKPAHVEWLNDDQLRFVLNEGRKRQIRRMCELVGLRVVGLKRVRIGNIKLADLPPGKWRFLGENEVF